MTHNLTTDDNKIIKFATLARLPAHCARQTAIYDGLRRDTQPFRPCAYLPARKGAKPTGLSVTQQTDIYGSRMLRLE